MVEITLGAARVRFTGRLEGDLGSASPPAQVQARRRAVVDRAWSVPRQVHGSGVLAVDHPGDGTGEDGDALVSCAPGVALAVLTADCAPVAITTVGPGGDTEGSDGDGEAGGAVLAVAHAGWRGLVDGVLERTAEAVGELRPGAGRLVAALGPCIHPGCYAFSPAELDLVAGRLGDGVRAVTTGGEPALDVPAAIRASLGRAGVELVHDVDRCTACASDTGADTSAGGQTTGGQTAGNLAGMGPAYFSHRARRDTGRQATVVWQ